MSTELATIDRLRTAIEQAESIPDILEAMSRAEAIRTYARKARLTLQAQNEAAAIKLRAERRAGQLLADITKPGVNQHTRGEDFVTLHDLGISRIQSHRWQRIAQIPEDVFDAYVSSADTRGDEITQADALKLSPKPLTDERASRSHMFQYAAPAIDVEIAAVYGLDASDAVADLVVEAITTALNDPDLNPRYAFAWAKHVGINDDGTMGEPWSSEQVAKMLTKPDGSTVSREYAESLYLRADRHVLRHLAASSLHALKVLVDIPSTT